MLRRFAQFLSMLCIIATPAISIAQTTDDLTNRRFARLDRDRNGTVTASEFIFARGLDFQRLDRNKDKYLDRKEFIDNRSPRNALSARAQRLRKLRLRRYSEIDQNRDGRIARQEYIAFGRRLYARLDQNNDAKLTLSEVRGRNARPSKKPNRSQIGSLFTQIDINRDGSISLDELLAARRIVFKRLDIDKNGNISAREFAGRNATITASSGQAAPPPRSTLLLRPSPRFLQLDRNKNGTLSIGEYLADSNRRFAAADQNRNARLSRAEFEGGTGR